ncbi:MAG TPA: hypothetical protein DCQ98_18600 [Planctomycetaceae bacterium]|nr:hypothetical protein [Planctomycetaceae bacterium]
MRTPARTRLGPSRKCRAAVRRAETPDGTVGRRIEAPIGESRRVGRRSNDPCRDDRNRIGNGRRGAGPEAAAELRFEPPPSAAAIVRRPLVASTILCAVGSAHALRNLSRARFGDAADCTTRGCVTDRSAVGIEPRRRESGAPRNVR